MEEQKIYDQMDWAAIEAVVYSEADMPREILGRCADLWVYAGGTEHGACA